MEYIKRLIKNAGSVFFILEEYGEYMLLLRLKDNLPVIAKGYDGKSWEHGIYGEMCLTREEQIRQLADMTELFIEKTGANREHEPEKRKAR